MSPPEQHARPRQGFTLGHVFGLLLVVAVVAIVAIPGFFSREAVTLDNAALLMVRELRSAQNRAAFLGTSVVVDFEEDGTGYAVRFAGGEPVRHPESRHRLVRHYDADGVFEGVTIGRVDFGGEPALTFDRYGLGHASGSVELRFGDGRRRVVYDAQTHELSVEGLARATVPPGS